MAFQYEQVHHPKQEFLFKSLNDLQNEVKTTLRSNEIRNEKFKVKTKRNIVKTAMRYPIQDDSDSDKKSSFFKVEYKNSNCKTMKHMGKSWNCDSTCDPTTILYSEIGDNPNEICPQCFKFRSLQCIPSLPVGWKELCFDDGKPYFLNTTNGDVSWNLPPNSHPYTIKVFTKCGSSIALCKCGMSRERRIHILKNIRIMAAVIKAKRVEYMQSQMRSTFSKQAIRIKNVALAIRR